MGKNKKATIEKDVKKVIVKEVKIKNRRSGEEPPPKGLKLIYFCGVFLQCVILVVSFIRMF